MRQRSLTQFELLRQKYSILEEREADVLSLRGIPSLSIDTEPAPAVFRLWVPKERPVWIKFGVREATPSRPSSSSDNDRDLLSDSPFRASGPFETQLPPGDQTLQIAAGSAREGSLPLCITLGETVLLRTSFDSPSVSGTGSSHITGATQLDYGPRQQLPWLLTSTMNVGEPATEKPHAFSLWLSDRASGFAPFPGEPSSRASHRGTR